MRNPGSIFASLEPQGSFGHHRRLVQVQFRFSYSLSTRLGIPTSRRWPLISRLIARLLPSSIGVVSPPWPGLCLPCDAFWWWWLWWPRWPLLALVFRPKDSLEEETWLPPPPTPSWEVGFGCNENGPWWGWRMIFPEVIRRPNPSWWENAYPERTLRRLLLPLNGRNSGLGLTLFCDLWTNLALSVRVGWTSMR